MKHTSFLCAVAAFLSVCLVSSMASAATIYSGTISTANGGVTGSGGWDGTGDNGFQVGYTVDQTGLLFTYNYVISGVNGTSLSKGLSHFIVEVSSNFTAANILGGTTSGGELRSASATPTTSTWETTGTAGIKWETGGGDTLSYNITIVTDRAPMTGEFYAKDGADTDAFNTATGILYVPDTLVAVPLPASVWGGLGLLAALGGMKLRARRMA